MKSKKHEISVVMPTYNSEKFIVKALDSLIAQENILKQIIVVDGCSTDNTLKILNSYKDYIDILISGPDLGIPDALNKGFNLVNHEYLIWLNSDDILANKNSLADSIKILCKSNQKFGYGHSILLDANDRVTRCLYTWQSNYKANRELSNIFTGSLIFKKECWNAFGGFNIGYKLAFEYELIDFLFDKFGDGCHINKTIGGFRLHEHGLSTRMNKIMQEEITALRGKVKSFRPYGRFVQIIGLIRNRKILKLILDKLFLQKSR
jgi:glycosyltransferase involved in cell wall biosynthesis